MSFISKKRIDGFSACFRQWKADGTHCKFVHGYGVYFDLTFEGELDHRNWVFDFGGFKRAKTKIDWNGKQYSPNEWFTYMFDHTTVVAEDDPELEWFVQGQANGVLQLRVLPQVGCEKFAELVFKIINDFLLNETEGRVKLKSVECFEHAKNSALYES